MSAAEEKLYKVRRFYRDDDARNGEIVARELTLDEAQTHCQDPSTQADIDETGTRPWFDGYDEE